MMESPMTRNCHVGFGERYEETHQSQDWEVRFVPTLFSPLLANIALHGLETDTKEAMLPFLKSYWQKNKSYKSRGMHDKHQVIEEPCDLKGTRTVLKPSLRGDSQA